MNDNDDWDEILNQEDNPYDNPDLTFECEDSAFDAGINFEKENISNDAIDFNTEIDFSNVDREIIKAFKAGVHEAASEKTKRLYGNENEEEVNLRTLIYNPDNYNDDGERIYDDGNKDSEEEE